MKTFKDIKTFKKKLNKSLCWEDYFKIGGRVFNIYEYGDLPNCEYVYFLNKRTNDLIYIKYDCPASEYIDGIKTTTKKYKFISLEFIPNANLWR